MDPIYENIKQQRELAAEIIACVEAGPDLAQSRGTMSTFVATRHPDPMPERSDLCAYCATAVPIG
jgi:hypothetical protein